MPTGGRDIPAGPEHVIRTHPLVPRVQVGSQGTSKDTKPQWGGQRWARHLHHESSSVSAPAEMTVSGISPEPSPGQMHSTVHQTPSCYSSLYLAVPPHAAGIDQRTGSISQFLLQYLSVPSISQSAPVSAVPIYTSSIYPCRLHCSHR